jgi:hypothetical protein
MIMTDAPDIRSYSLVEFFARNYKVPRYQRNYSWGEEQVTQLLKDLFDFNESSDPFYLLGDVIAANCQDRDFDFDLIDGQQRATTLVILFAVLYKDLKAGNATDDDLQELFNALKKQGQLRLKMSGDASEIVLNYLNGTNVSELDKSTPSRENVVSALEVIIKALGEQFEADKFDNLLRFTNRLLSMVYLGSLTLASMDQATEFFERVNNRGVKLTSAELLKNRLLQNIVGDAEYDWAADKWDNAEKGLMNKSKIGSLEYLLRQMRQADLGQKVQDKELFKKMEPLVKDEESCLRLIDELSTKQQALLQILENKTPQGGPDPYPEGTDFFGFTQAIGVKLAGSHLSPEAYLHLSKRLAARSILSLLASERSQSFEKQTPGWSQSIKGLGASAETSDVDACLNFQEEDMKQLFAVAWQMFKDLKYNGTPGQSKRIRYILAKANHLVNEIAPEQNYSLKDFLTTSKKSKRALLPGFDIDHIYAQAPNVGMEYLHNIGNLTLLHSTDNSGAGADEPIDKKVIYGHSKAYLTKALTNFDQTPRVENVIAQYRCATIDDDETWSSDKFEARALMYWNLVSGSLIADLGFDFKLDPKFD